MLDQVLVNYSLFFKKIFSQLILYVNLIVFVLNFSQFFKRDTVLFKYFVEFRSIDNHLFVSFYFFDAFN